MNVAEMKLGIMQPYFFPYIGYFSLINCVDKWVIFDSVQYIYHGWINRNRILHPNREQWQYIIVPLTKHTRNTPINQIKISNASDWKGRILGQLEHYKKKAPFFTETINLVDECLSLNTDNISKLNEHILKLVCAKLNIGFNYEIFSDMNLNIDNLDDPGDWALNISEKLKADEYINPVGGKDIFDNSKFEDKGIKLSFLSVESSPYNQFNSGYIPGLSIIDVLMFNTADNIKNMLNKYQLS